MGEMPDDETTSAAGCVSDGRILRIRQGDDLVQEVILRGRLQERLEGLKDLRCSPLAYEDDAKVNLALILVAAVFAFEVAGVLATNDAAVGRAPVDQVPVLHTAQATVAHTGDVIEEGS